MGHGKSALALVLCLAAGRALGAAEVVSCPVLVIGGSASGVAAAHAAYQLFKEWQVTDQRVCLVEETGWLGGQFLTVGELDEPPNVGGWPVRGPYSRSYRELRKGVQDAALMKYGPYACSSPPFSYDTFDPGRNTANLLAYEPSLIVPLIQAKLAPASPPPPGPPLPIRVFLHTRVTAKRLSSDGATVLGVDAHDDEHGVDLQLNATYTIDATEFGDLLGPAWGPATPNRVGVDAFSVASEPSAPATADPYCTQPVTVPIYLKWTTPAFVPQPSNWSALQGFYYKRPELCAYDPGEPGCGVPPLCTPPGFTTARESYWSWRRIHSRTQFANGGVDSTNIIVHGLRIPVAGNPDPQAPTVGGNDFNRNCDTGPGGCELVADLAARPAKLARALDLSRGFAYFMQTTMAPGSPSTVTPWQLATEVTDDAFGAGDGFAPVPYVRESRRLKAVKTVREQDISRDILQQTYGPGRTRGEMFTDTVGIGHYAIDIHDCAAGDPWHDTPTNPNPPLDRAAVLPFQVPLGAMVPAAARFADGRVPTEGLLATGKNMGLTHITNGAYRLQPIEWHSGLAAGAAAAVAIHSGSSPRFMTTALEPQFGPGPRAHVRALRRVQQALVRTLRSPIYWWADVFDPQPGPPNPAGQALFEATQMVAADGIMVDLPGHGLRFEPDTPLTRQDGAVILMRMIHALTPLQTCAGTPYVDVPCDFTSRYPYIQALKNASYLPPSTIPDPNCTSGPIDATHFQPTCAMRRRDWVRFMMTALQQFPFYSPTPHFDVPPGDPDYGNIEGALALGLLDVSSGPFNAEGPLTRGAAARMAYGAISRIVYAIP